MDKQIDRQTDRQTDSYIDRYIHRYIHTYRQIDGQIQINRQTDRQIDRQIDKQIDRDRQMDRQIDRQMQIYRYRYIRVCMHACVSAYVRVCVPACVCVQRHIMLYLRFEDFQSPVKIVKFCSFDVINSQGALGDQTELVVSPPLLCTANRESLRLYVRGLS